MAWVSPHSVRNNVVLPLPLPPWIQISPPGSRMNDTFPNRRRSPRAQPSPIISNISSLCCVRRSDVPAVAYIEEMLLADFIVARTGCRRMLIDVIRFQGQVALPQIGQVNLGRPAGQMGIGIAFLLVILQRKLKRPAFQPGDVVVCQELAVKGIALGRGRGGRGGGGGRRGPGAEGPRGGG